MMNSLEQSRPLCPDHRDKQRGRPCLACTIEVRDKKIHKLSALAKEATEIIEVLAALNPEILKLAKVESFLREISADAMIAFEDKED